MYQRTHDTTTILFSMLIAGALAACDDDTSEAAADAGVIAEVPAIEGAVQAADLCDRYAAIFCAANAACCSQEARRFDSEAACLAATRCPGEVAQLDGLGYDAASAGDYLRALAADAATCRPPRPSAAIDFVTGSGAADDACSFGAATPQCGAGLACGVADGGDPASDAAGVCAPAASSPTALAADGAACGEEASCASGRCLDGVCAAQVEDGAGCADDGDCRSHVCEGGMCAPSGDAYCAPTADEAPSNTDWTDLDEICVKARGSSRSYGTDAQVRVAYLYEHQWYTCTMPGGIDDGDTRCCLAQKGTATFRSSTSSAGDVFVVVNDSDGMAVREVKIKKGDHARSRGTFEDGPNIDCDNCDFGSWGCKSCWVDADSQGSCAVGVFPMGSSHSVTCANELRNSTFF